MSEESVLVRLARLEEQRKADRAIAAARREADTAALALVKEQNERHFSDLNHESSRIAASQSVSVSREKFDGFVASYNKDREALAIRMAAIAGAATVVGYFVDKVFLGP